MALPNATLFPINGQAWVLAPVCFYDNAGNFISGWTAPATKLYLDDGSSIAGSAPIEHASDGVGYLSLSAAQMTCNVLQVRCTITNNNAQPFVASVYTADTSEPTGRWYTQAIVKLEAGIMQLLGACFNAANQNNALQTIFKRDNSTTMVSASVSESDTTGTRGQFT